MSELVLNTTWHDASRRKLEIVKAITERDLKTMLEFHRAYLLYEGEMGNLTSEKTKGTYASGVKNWFAYCWADNAVGYQPPNPLRVKRVDVKGYLAKLASSRAQRTGKLLSPMTVNTYLSGIRSFYEALGPKFASVESQAVNPFASVKAPRDPRESHERKPAVPDEVYKRIVDHLIFEAMRQEKKHKKEDLALANAVARRDLVIVQLYGTLSLRLSEVSYIDMKDIDLENRKIKILRKGSKQVTKDLSQGLHDAIFRWIGFRREYALKDETALIVNFGKTTPKTHSSRKGTQVVYGARMNPRTMARIVRKLFDDAGLGEEYSTHSLRHRAGTRAYEVTGDIFKTASLLDHSRVDTSKIYAKRAEGMLKEVMEEMDA